MKKALMLIMMWVPFGIHGQERGIHFEQGLTWEEIKAKAKVENKYIFMDCYATWCVPCKTMDREIYSNDSIGEYINTHFISVKVQMDSSKNDDKYIQNWYKTSHALLTENKISAFPTYLFFLPNAQLIHKGLGLKSKEEFTEVASDAMMPEKQYFKILDRYNHHKLNFDQFPALVKQAESFNDKDIAFEVAKSYIHDFLDKKAQVLEFSKLDIEFINENTFVITTRDKVFDIFYRDKTPVNKFIYPPNFARSFTDQVIFNEEILPFIKKESGNSDLNWTLISSKLKRKYGEKTAARIILDGKFKWYGFNFKKKNKWVKEYTKCFVEKVDKYGLNGYSDIELGITIGNTIEDLILKHCDNEEIINKAIGWMEKVMQKWPGTMYSYVYAGLLYKSGDVHSAIKWQEMTLQLQEFNAYKKSKDYDLKAIDYYQRQMRVLLSMKNGINRDEIAWGYN